jgi:superoxide reductase
MTFYVCSVCNQVHIKIIDQKKPLICCDNETVELIPNTIEAEVIQHKPIIRKIGNFVTLDVPKEHPMVDIHHILFMGIETNEGIQIKYLKKEEPARVGFVLSKDEYVLSVFVFCSVHWLFSLDYNKQ